MEEGLQHQVLGLIAAEKQLAEHDQVRARLRRVRAGLPDPVRIAGDIADRGIELGECDGKRIGHGRRLDERVTRRRPRPGAGTGTL